MASVTKDPAHQICHGFIIDFTMSAHPESQGRNIPLKPFLITGRGLGKIIGERLDPPNNPTLDPPNGRLPAGRISYTFVNLVPTLYIVSGMHDPLYYCTLG